MVLADVSSFRTSALVAAIARRMLGSLYEACSTIELHIEETVKAPLILGPSCCSCEKSVITHYNRTTLPEKLTSQKDLK
jgi:hypothetical protein